MSKLRILHRNILEIAILFDDFCAQHGLSYYLLGGTALGAARHGGFIPWDDDFDVCMKIHDYEKLLSLRDKFSNSGLYLQLENTSEWPLMFSKLRLDDSFYVEKEDIGRQMHSGIYIDIMCLSPGYNNVFLRYSQFLCSKLLSAAALTKRDYRPRSLYKKFFLFFARVFCRGKLKTFLLYHSRHCLLPFAADEYLNHFFGRATFSKASIPAAYCANTKRILFEGYPFSCMLNLNDYLFTRFGAGWHLPPSDQVRCQFPSHCIDFTPRPDLNFPL